MENEVFRNVIVERLVDVKNRNKQIKVFIDNYMKLTDNLNRTTKARSFSTNENCESTPEDVSKLKDEISNLYRQKCYNDQNLIDANRKIVENELKISDISSEQNTLHDNYNELCKKIAEMESECQKYRIDNGNLKDEVVALKLTFNSLSSKKEFLEKERLQLMNKIRQLNEQNIEYLNAQSTMEARNHSRTRCFTSPTDRPIEAAEDALTSCLSETNLTSTVRPPNRITLTMEASDAELNDVLWINSSTFASVGNHRTVDIWRLDSSGQCLKIKSLAGCNAAISRIDFDKERNWIMAASYDQNVRVWNVETERVLANLTGHQNKASCARFYKTCNALSGSYDRMIKLWDLQTSKCIRSFFPGSTVLDIASRVSNNADVFVSGHFDKSVRFWDGRSDEEANRIDLEGKVTSIYPCMNGMEILCSCKNDQLVLVDVRTCKILSRFSSESYKTSFELSRCVVSQDEEFVAAGSLNELVIWNKKSTKVEAVLKTSSSVRSLSWGEMGLLAATSSKQVNLWK